MTRTAPAPGVPWPVNALLSWFGRLAVGLCALLVAWWGVSGTTELSRLILWLNIAVVGLTVTAVANMLWLLEGRRAVGLRQSAALASFDRAVGARREMRPQAAPDVAVASGVMTRYHRSDCTVVVGKDVDALPVAQHVACGRVPCGICLG